MINEVVKDFQDIYANCEEKFEGFSPRPQQKRMSYEIAKAFCQEKGFVVCEAGTGVGKSFAYMMSVIPIALKKGKKVIISTATIALQEQLVNKDLPLFQTVTSRPFSFKLAKGRSNYACYQNIVEALGDGSGLGGLPFVPEENDFTTLAEMLKGLDENTWDGERESWETPVSDKLWAAIRSDQHRCKKSLSAHKDCPFTKARADLQEQDVIVANHALVLADLALSGGGGLILPSAEDAFYIFDEGHHLPDIARESVSGQFALKGTMDFNESVRKTMFRYNKKVQTNDDLEPVFENSDQIIDLLADLDRKLIEVQRYFESVPHKFEEADTYLIREPNKLELDMFKAAEEMATSIISKCNKVVRNTKKLVEQGMINDKKETEQIISDFSFFVQRFDGIKAVSGMIFDNEDDVIAKWVEVVKGRGFVVNASPVESNKTLDRLLWQHAKHVVITSATLSALGNFELYSLESGVPDEAIKFILGSPFDYPNKAKLYLPPVKVSPASKDGFTKFLGESMLKDYVSGSNATLILFSSYWQMRDVYSQIEGDALKQGYLIQKQGDAPKETILERHRKAIADGQKSILMGTGSFSEGLDLPRNLLDNVVITKIPFGLPTDPVSTIHSEHVVANGGNAFFDISLPDASRQLIQAVGRLIRTVEDEGRVTILDNRMTTKGYGKRLLACLPPFDVIKGNPSK
ncbi:ATP-dependent DNA helicase DinG [Vibrio crassostreae]|uniref:ATP-dependent DNA helicase DinG n=1 Tax=Vibrio crassostreae TaxID=246167 RepID=UPI001B30134D|nr:ATP-dependent DNA helicase DinG [Vibrio crassostreae]